MAIPLIALSIVILSLAFNEFTLPLVLGTEYSSLEAADLIIVRAIDVCLLSFGGLIFLFRNNRSALINLGLTTGSLIFLFGAAELALRIIRTAPEGVNIYADNPSGKGSFRLKRNYTKSVTMGDSTIAIHTNAEGMHWRDLRANDSGKKQTIAFVGDSFTFGLWASDWSKGLVGVLEKTLQNDDFRILNFGVPGYGFADIELQIIEDVITHNPQHIVVVSYMGNDLLDTYLGMQRYRVSESGLLTFRPDVLEGKIPQQYRRKHVTSLLSMLSIFESVKLVREVFQKYTYTRESPTAAQAFVRKDYESDLFWSQTEYPEFAKNALEASLDSLRRIHQYCLARDVNLSLVAIPSQSQVYFPDNFGDGYDVKMPQNFFAEFARSEDIPYFDLLPHLQKWVAINQADLHYRFDGHFNDLGHEVSGQLIAIFMAEVISKDQGP